jgi:hypothetical protein
LGSTGTYCLKQKQNKKHVPGLWLIPSEMYGYFSSYITDTCVVGGCWQGLGAMVATISRNLAEIRHESMETDSTSSAISLFRSSSLPRRVIEDEPIIQVNYLNVFCSLTVLVWETDILIYKETCYNKLTLSLVCSFVWNMKHLGPVMKGVIRCTLEAIRDNTQQLQTS